MRGSRKVVKVFMSRSEPFFAMARMPLLASSFGLMLLSLPAVAANDSPLDSARDIDCNAVNSGNLNVELAGIARATRVVKLRAGETLDFALETVPGPFGSLTLVTGKGSPRPLLAGPTGTTVRFVAPAQGTFGFEFSAEGEADAAFTVSCAPAQSAQQSGNRTGSFASQRAAKLLAKSSKLRALPEPEPPADSIDPETWKLILDSQLTAVDPSGAPRKSVVGNLGMVKPPDDLDVWLQAGGKRYPLGEQKKAPLESNAAAVSGGGLNFKVLPQIMIGAGVQFDQPGEQLKNAPLSLSDRGWMAGPVTTVQLVPGISLDARAAWGESQPAAPYSAASGMGADRHLVNARLANTQMFGNWRFSPSVAVNYQEETQLSSGPSTDGGLVSQTFASGRVDIRPELSYRLDVDGSTFVEPKLAIGSFWDINGLSRLTPGSSEHEAARIKAEAGVTIGSITGTKLQATGGVEQGSPGAADTWSGRFQLSVPLK